MSPPKEKATFGEVAPKTEYSTGTMAGSVDWRKRESCKGQGGERAHELTAATWFAVMKAVVANRIDLEQVRVSIRADRGAA